MRCGPLQNGPAAHRWAVAHRLKSTALKSDFEARLKYDVIEWEKVKAVFCSLSFIAKSNELLI